MIVVFDKPSTAVYTYKKDGQTLNKEMMGMTIQVYDTNFTKRFDRALLRISVNDL
jgi:uncharacterized RDD family membrane protein YckC